MIRIGLACIGITALLFARPATAHGPDLHSETLRAEYIANEGVMALHGDVKVLFDPLFENGFEQFRVPDAARLAALMSGSAPYDDVDVVFISHAHGDHFDAAMMNRYLRAQPDVQLVAPAQALDEMRLEDNWDADLRPQIHSVKLALNEAGPLQLSLKQGGKPLSLTLMRVPHIGGALYADVDNLIYRAVLDDGAAIMHLGDADADAATFEAHANIFAQRHSEMAFVPYWFAADPGEAQTRKWLNADQIIAIHVAIEVPEDLKASGMDYFSKPGEGRWRAVK